MFYKILPPYLQDLLYCLCGLDSTTGCLDIIPICFTSLFCCGSCNKCCCSQRSFGHKVANYDPQIRVYSSESPEVHRLIGRSFSGTTETDPELMVDWVVGKNFEDRSSSVRRKIFTCFMACAASMEGEQGLVLGATDDQQINPKLEAILVARKVYNSRKECSELLSLCALCGASCRLLCRNECVWELCGDEKMQTRSDATDKFLKDAKTFSVGNESVYWYINIMAVDPSAQGKKHSSRLMRAICQQADIDKLPVHLECSGDRNRQIYERFGFYPIKRVYVKSTDGQSCDIPAYVMYRPPIGKNIKNCHEVIDCSDSNPSIESQVMERGGNELIEAEISSALM